MSGRQGYHEHGVAAARTHTQTPSSNTAMQFFVNNEGTMQAPPMSIRQESRPTSQISYGNNARQSDMRQEGSGLVPKYDD